MTPHGDLELLAIQEGPKVVRRLLWKGVSVADAEDLVQRALTEILASMPDASYEKIRYALYLRTLQRKIDDTRRAAILERVLVELGASLTSADPETLVVAEETARTATRLVRGLSPRQREDFALHAQKYSYAEIARMTNRKVSAVSSSISLARKKLAEGIAHAGESLQAWFMALGGSLSQDGRLKRIGVFAQVGLAPLAAASIWSASAAPGPAVVPALPARAVGSHPGWLAPVLAWKSGGSPSTPRRVAPLSGGDAGRQGSLPAAIAPSSLRSGRPLPEGW
jgi:RNA polymerase sigma factor (sigma-70 family)